MSGPELARKLEQATALVMTDKGTGTGFFISDKLLITNRHVVESAAGGNLFVTSRALGLKRRATVLRVTAGSTPEALISRWCGLMTALGLLRLAWEPRSKSLPRWSPPAIPGSPSDPTPNSLVCWPETARPRPISILLRARFSRLRNVPAIRR